MTTQQKVQTGEVLPVMEHFHTVQGEGFNTGKAAYFIRIAGCDVGCVWCDVKESWDADQHPVLGVETIVEHAKSSGAKYAVITGGEPTLYELGPLTKALRKAGLQCFIETSGTNELTGTWDWVCFSPKKFKPPVESVYKQADELKVIVCNKHDLKWGQRHAEKVKEDCKLYFQPEWDRSEKALPLIIDYIKSHPRWQISLQTHKFIGVR